MTNVQKTFIAVAFITSITVAIYKTRDVSTLRNQIKALQQKLAPLDDQNKQLTRERNEAARELAALSQENERLNRNKGELVRLRGQVGLLRQQMNDLAKLRAAEASARNLKPFAQSGALIEFMPDLSPPPERIPRARTEIVGIGVSLVLDRSTQRILLEGVVANSPAALAGLSSGFSVQKIDGVPIVGKSLVDCVNLIRGTEGTKVTLELLTPDGNRIETVELTRSKIQL